MTHLTLTPREVQQFIKNGSGLLIRPVEPQPKNVNSLNGKTLKFFDDPVFGGSVLAPEHSTMMGAMQQGQWITKEFSESPFGKPGEEFKVLIKKHGQALIEPLTLTHTGTEVKRVLDICQGDLLKFGIQCPLCGYTQKDENIHLDHNLCSDASVVSTGSKPHPIWSEFEKQWQSQHPDYPWAENPWVFIGKIEVKK